MCAFEAYNLLCSGQPRDLRTGGTERGALQELCAARSVTVRVCRLHPEPPAVTLGAATARFVQHRREVSPSQCCSLAECQLVCGITQN